MGIADLVRYLKGLVCYVLGWLILPVNPFSKPIENHQKSNGTVKNAVVSNKNLDVATYTEKSVYDTEIRNKLSALIDNRQDSDDDEKVTKFLRENNVDVNVGNANGQTLLHTAVRNGYVNVVDTLLKNGAHVNQKDNKGWTPLLIAAQIGNDKIVDVLLRNGADVNATVVDGKSSLYLASLNGHSKVVELLLQKTGININATDDWSSTPLYAASFHGNESVVEILLKNGAEINTKMSALDVAIENGQKNIVAILERYKN